MTTVTVGGSPSGDLPVSSQPALSGAERKRRWIGIGFVLPAALYVVIFFGYPLLKNLLMGSQEYSVSSFYTGEAPFNGFDNYTTLFGAAEFWPTVARTLIFTAVSIFFQFTIGLALANFFLRKFPLSSLIRSLMLLPWLLPLVVSASVWRWIYDQDNGILNAALSMMGLNSEPIGWLTTAQWSLVAVIITNIWIGIPFNLVILYGGLQSIPESLYEAASLDGAGAWQRFRHITWPLLKPVTAVTLILGFVYTLKVFDVIMVLTGGGPAASSQTLTIWLYKLSFEEFSFGQGAAVGNILIVMAVVMGFFYIRSNRKTMG